MNNSNLIITPKKFIQTLSIIHLALMMGVTMFTVVVYSIVEEWKLDFNIQADVISILPFFLATAGILIGAFIYKKIIKSLEKKETLKQKLIVLQSASIIKFALLEGPILFCIVVGLLTTNLFFLLLAGVLILYFLTIRPTKVKIENDLKLKGEHKSQFNKADEELV